MGQVIVGSGDMLFYGGAWNGTVDYYADLPDAATHEAQIWAVLNPSGIYGINYKSAGLYISNGTTWNVYSAFDSFQLSATSPLSYNENTSTMSTSMSTNKLIGRYSSGSGVMQEVGIDSSLVINAGNLKVQTVTENEISLSDVTTNNATTLKHGFLPKLSGSSANYLNGEGNWTIPSGIVSTYTAVFFSAQTSVTVNHNFGVFPVIQIRLSSGERCIAPVDPSETINSFTILFPTPQTGTVIVSVGSDQAPSYIAVNSNYTTTTTYNIIQALTAGITITVETAAGKTGLEKTINNSSSGDITVLPTGLELLGIYSSITLSTQESISIYSDGSNWRIY